MPDDDLFNLIEEADEEKVEAPETDGDGSVGQRLRAARRQRGLSVYQAAQELRTDPAVLRAIEADDFSLLGAPVYIKGHLRKYAALLGLPPDEVFDDYARTHELSESVPLVNRAVDPGRPHKSGYWLRVFLVLLLIVALGVAIAWWALRSDTTAGRSPAIAGARAQPTGDTAVPLYTGPSATGRVDDEPGETTPQAIDRVAIAQSAASPGASLRMELMFTDGSWVEITDADGDRLLFGLMDAGAAHSIEGTPPLRVLLGSAEAVQLEVDGRAYEVPPASVRDGLARFSVEAP